MESSIIHMVSIVEDWQNWEGSGHWQLLPSNKQHMNPTFLYSWLALEAGKWGPSPLAALWRTPKHLGRMLPCKEKDNDEIWHMDMCISEILLTPARMSLESLGLLSAALSASGGFWGNWRITFGPWSLAGASVFVPASCWTFCFWKFRANPDHGQWCFVDTRKKKGNAV